MNLGKNINSLLRRYAEVYVPGIGVFKRIHSPAQFDKQNNVFLPPISYVELDYSAEQGFNMVHYIQQQENLSLGQAQQILDDTVEILRNDLGQFGQVKLDDLGLLISYGSSLVFKPLDLSGFNFQPVANLVGPEIETVIPVREDEHALAEPAESLAPESPVEVNNEAEPFVDVETFAAAEKDAESEVEAEYEEHEPVALDNEDPLPAVEPAPESIVESTAPKTEEEVNSADVGLSDAVAVPIVDNTVDNPVPDEQQFPSQKEVGAIAAANSTYVPDIDAEEARNSNAIWYWITAAIVLVMIAVGVLYTNPGLKNSLFGGVQPVLKPAGDTIVQKNNPPISDTASNALAADSLKKVDSLAKTTTDSLNGTAVTAGKKTVTAKKAPVLQADPVIKESIPVAQPKYQVVIGSARTMAQAEEEAKRLRQLGYKTARAVEGKYKRNRKKVILNTYMTKEEADLAQKSVEKKIQGAWVETL
ncbi:MULTISPECIES: SPOR domain-containing protein [unclassified Sphingobacterium]|uniref:HU domain-containing protein n=1 Tax=unclassified Sphingobacterium TaxID=2609468 RepID=UPI0025F43C0F|nr:MULTISPECIES: SPOR domain-containing protein [unclassified Sphingobacterium]